MLLQWGILAREGGLVSRGCSKDIFEAREALWLRLVLRLLIAPLKLTRYSSENCTIPLRLRPAVKNTTQRH